MMGSLVSKNKNVTPPFIVFDGLPGTSKSTQIRIIGDRLKRKGIPVVLTREPGGTPNGEALRSLMVDGERISGILFQNFFL